MGRNKVGNNEPCPCGSGQKYKKCCKQKGIDFVADEDDGQIYQQLPMTDELVGMMDEQEEHFRQVHGRDPGPGDKVFFDAPPLEHAEHQMVEAMRESGLDPAIVHAFIETGQLVTEANIQHIPTVRVNEWNNAVQSYNDEHGESLPSIPWTRTQWRERQTTDLADFEPFTEYIDSIRRELFSNEERRDSCFRAVELMMAVTPETDPELVDEEWLAERSQELELNENNLVKILEGASFANPEKANGYRRAVELGIFVEDLVRNAQKTIGIEDHERINELREQLLSFTYLKLVVGINQHFGLDDKSDYPG